MKKKRKKVNLKKNEKKWILKKMKKKQKKSEFKKMKKRKINIFKKWNFFFKLKKFYFWKKNIIQNLNKITFVSCIENWKETNKKAKYQENLKN